MSDKLFTSIPPTKTLRNGLELCMVGFGTWKLDGDTVKEPLKKAISSGYTLIDTAEIYKNEREIGDLLKELYNNSDTLEEIEKLRIAAKKENKMYPVAISTGNKYNLWITSKVFPSHYGDGEVIKQYFSSLNALGVEQIDLYLLHWPGDVLNPKSSQNNRKTRLMVWRQMEKLYKEKKVRAIGVANFMQNHLEELLEDGVEIVPFLNQVEFHPLIANFSLLEFCKSKNIVLQAYSSLGIGNTTLLQHPTVVQIANECNRTPAQILLRWALQHNIPIIPRSKTPSRIEENIKLFDFAISKTQMDKLDNMCSAQNRFCLDPTAIS